MFSSAILNHLPGGITGIPRETSDLNSNHTPLIEPLLQSDSADCCAAAGCSASAGEEKESLRKVQLINSQYGKLFN